MKPYDAPVGSVWLYDPQYATGFDPMAYDDNEDILVVLEGYNAKYESYRSPVLCRRAFALLSGEAFDFTDDSRINCYSTPMDHETVK